MEIVCSTELSCIYSFTLTIWLGEELLVDRKNMSRWSTDRMCSRIELNASQRWHIGCPAALQHCLVAWMFEWLAGWLVGCVEVHMFQQSIDEPTSMTSHCQWQRHHDGIHATTDDWLWRNLHSYKNAHEKRTNKKGNGLAKSRQLKVTRQPTHFALAPHTHTHIDGISTALAACAGNRKVIACCTSCWQLNYVCQLRAERPNDWPTHSACLQQDSKTPDERCAVGV